MNKAGAKPVWAGREFRLDPFHLPQTVTYATRDDSGDITFTLHERGAVVKRILPASNLPVSLALPPCAFRGVTARATENELGDITVTLELMHTDPQLSVPLLVAHDLNDVAGGRCVPDFFPPGAVRAVRAVRRGRVVDDGRMALSRR